MKCNNISKNLLLEGLLLVHFFKTCEWIVFWFKSLKLFLILNNDFVMNIDYVIFIFVCDYILGWERGSLSIYKNISIFNKEQYRLLFLYKQNYYPLRVNKEGFFYAID